MKNVGLKLVLLAVAVCLLMAPGCKTVDKGNDIANGSWGFLLDVGGSISALVYDFEGDPDEGVIFYNAQQRGTYVVTGGIQVDFTVNHYNAEQELFVYVYSGTFSDFYHMSGTFYVNYPDGSVVRGNWTAQR